MISRATRWSGTTGRTTTGSAKPDATAGALPRRVLVTGSDSGIGKATAVALAEGAEHVTITWHQDEQGARRTGCRA